MLVELYPIGPAKLCAPFGLHALALILRLHLAARRLAWRMATETAATGVACTADVLRVTSLLPAPERLEDDPNLDPRPLDTLDLELWNLIDSLRD